MNECLYSWGTQFDPEDFSDLHECHLEAGHEGPHKDGDTVFVDED